MIIKLDDELIKLPEEGDLDAEAEQADDMRQKIGHTILNIEDALATHGRDEGKDTY